MGRCELLSMCMNISIEQLMMFNHKVTQNRRHNTLPYQLFCIKARMKAWKTPQKKAILTDSSFQDLFYRDVNDGSSRSDQSTFIYRIVSYLLTGLWYNVICYGLVNNGNRLDAFDRLLRLHRKPVRRSTGGSATIQKRGKRMLDGWAGSKGIPPPHNHLILSELSCSWGFIENHQLNRAVTPIAGMLYPGSIIMMIWSRCECWHKFSLH